MNSLPHFYMLSPEIIRARSMNLPMVALESTVITHGLPYPENFNIAQQMESEVRALGVVPATIAILDGRVCVGLNENQLERLAREKNLSKVSARDIGPTIARGGSGGTTVAATMVIASNTGIHVFATGGIGGVHRQPEDVSTRVQDISADLTELSRVPIIVVCAGAKAILDVPATLEMLETYSVPVVGYGTNDFPAFYSRSSGLKTSARADRPEDLVNLAHAHWNMGMKSAVLVTVPPPEDTALPNDKVDAAIKQALSEIYKKGIHGQSVTPELLKRVSELTQGDSLRANLALLLNNARIAGTLARYLTQNERQAVV